MLCFSEVFSFPFIQGFFVKIKSVSNYVRSAFVGSVGEVGESFHKPIVRANLQSGCFCHCLFGRGTAPGDPPSQALHWLGGGSLALGTAKGLSPVRTLPV